MLAPIQRETFLGNAEVLQAFDISKVGKVAGCRVTEGVVRKGARVRIIREDVVVLELGTLQTLKRFKDEVNEVNSGQECGMAFAGFQDIKAGDAIECFTVEEVARTLLNLPCFPGRPVRAGVSDSSASAPPPGPPPSSA